jgi:uncharacterized protein
MDGTGTLQKTKEIVLKALGDQDVQIYLFGSWARHEQKRSSDIDIAIEGKEDISASVRKVREQLEDSTIPFRFDVVDMAFASEILKQRIRREGILWKKFRNDSNSPRKL